MAAGLQGSKVPEEFDIGDIYALVLRLSKEDATRLRERARPLIAYVRALPEEHAALLAQIVEHAAEVRMSL